VKAFILPAASDSISPGQIPGPAKSPPAPTMGGSLRWPRGTWPPPAA